MIRQNIKLYRKICYSKGFGVNSPFAFSFITKVIEEKCLFYAFDKIEYQRRKLLKRNDPVSLLTEKETQDKKYGALLFRIVNYLKCRKILEVGSSSGIMLLYLAAPSSSCLCTAIEERECAYQASSAAIKNAGRQNCSLLNENYLSGTVSFLEKNPDTDLIFINTLENFEETKELLKKLIPFLGRVVLIVDNILCESDRSLFLDSLKEEEKISLSFDLNELWIYFIGYKVSKQHHKVFFDYGKKPDLYKNGRQRIHFFGQRKKSRQNG